ncbi:hypothetical protein MXB_3597, partial [Myxobolus squamalis]
FPEIISVHELHIWQLASSTFIATLHIKIENSVDIKKIVSDIKLLFKSHEVFSVTIQPEIVDFNRKKTFAITVSKLRKKEA